MYLTVCQSYTGIHLPPHVVDSGMAIGSHLTPDLPNESVKHPTLDTDRYLLWHLSDGSCVHRVFSR